MRRSAVPACLLAASGVAAAALALPSLARADGDNAHGEIYDELLPGGGVVSEGLGLAQRFGAPATGTMTISGIPEGAEVVQAWLYWMMIGGGFDDSATVNGDEYTGTWIGTTQDTCWGLGDNHVFRAAVRSTVSQNGTYEVTGFQYDSTTDNQGFSILVVYRESSSTEITRVVVNDGAIYAGSGYPVIASNMSFDPVGGPITRFRTHFTVGDSQGADDGPTRVNGTQVDFDNWEGDGCYSPGGCPSPDPGGDGAMWDDDTIDLSSWGLVQPGASSLSATISDPPGSDCLAWMYFVAEITYPNPCPDQDVDQYTTCDGDCDDLDPTVHPNAVEIDDDKDNDCNGITDDLAPDGDGDGYTVATGDCDDSDEDVHPGADEICANGSDDDCDEQVDELDCVDDPGDDDDDDDAGDDDAGDDDAGDDDGDDDDGGGGGRGRGGCTCADLSAGGGEGRAALVLLPALALLLLRGRRRGRRPLQ